MTDSGMKQLIIFHVRKNLANKIFTVEKRINGIFKLILTHLRKLVARKELHTHCCKNKLNLWETMLRPEGEKKGGELGGCEGDRKQWSGKELRRMFQKGNKEVEQRKRKVRR